MKQLKAYVAEEQLDTVVRALELAGAPEVTIVRVEVAGAAVRPEWVDISTASPVHHNRHLIKLELVCPDAEAERYADVIRRLAGADGRGHISVSDVSLAG